MSSLMFPLFVLIQVELLGRAVVTLVTVVRPLARVRVHVIPQLVLCPELAA